MIREMVLDIGPDVRSNLVNPDLVAIEQPTEDMDEEHRERLGSIHPVGRLGRSENVAGAVAFLVSGDSAYVRGTHLTVDGGHSAVMQDDTLPSYRSKRESWTIDDDT